MKQANILPYNFLTTLTFLIAFLTTPHTSESSNYALVARTIVEGSSWGVLTTLDLQGRPFGNVMSFASIDGVPYFYLAISKDPTGAYALNNPKASFITSPFLSRSRNNGSTGVLGPDSPVCTNINFNGMLLSLEKNSKEGDVGKAAFFRGHPQFSGNSKYCTELPAFLVPDFRIFKLEIKGILLVNACAPPVQVPVEKYMQVVV